VENNLSFNLSRTFDLELNSGYNFKEEKYLDLEAIMEFKPLREWTLSLGINYDLNENRYNENLIFKSIFKGERLTHRLGMHYDLNNSDLRKLDNQLIYELDGDYGWYLESNLNLDYEYEDQIREANLQLKKKFHCRELTFGYDYMKEEFTVQYTINLFPSQGIGFTQSEDDSSFDLGIREQLENED